MFQIGTVLFEQDQKIRVVAYQMFRYPHVRLTEIEAIDVRVATHRKVLFHCILLVTCHVIKNKNKIWRASLAETSSLLLEKVKPISSINVNKFSTYWFLMQRCNVDATISSRHTRSRNVRCSGSWVSLRERWFLLQFDGSQMIARIVLGSILLALFRVASHSWFRVAVCDAYRQRLQHEFHAH